MSSGLLPHSDTRTEEIAALCRRYHVARLELFGSAVGERFSTTTSDFDFLVRFRPNSPLGLADSYLGLAGELELLLGRPVDLVTEDSIRNPYFRASLNASRKMIFNEP